MRFYYYLCLQFLFISEISNIYTDDINNTLSKDILNDDTSGIPKKHENKDIVVVRIKNNHEEYNMNAIARSHGFYYSGPVGNIPGYHEWKRENIGNNMNVYSHDAKSGKYILSNVITSKTNSSCSKITRRFDSLENSSIVEWWEESIPIQRFKRGTWINPSDPLFSQQWHLSSGYLNVISTWKNEGVTGIGVNLGVVDDGLQFNHPDLNNNFNQELSWDFNEDDDDPTPSQEDGHGTCASGVAGANRETHCGVGVAYNVNIIGLRLLGGWTTDVDEARALCHRCDENPSNTKSIHIYSNSWGPADNGITVGGPGHVTKQALKYCIENGRGGKGSIYIWAGGNGRYDHDNSNYDGYANSIYTIAVAAVDYNKVYSWYSEPGANILCSAPSSGSPSRGIVTTDLMGRFGYSQSSCTYDFGGTSAAAPQIAGVTALLLEACNSLSWRDVQEIYVKTSTVIDPYNTVWTTNSAGNRHSHDYGFGLVNANNAVKMAKNICRNRFIAKRTSLDNIMYVKQDTNEYNNIYIREGNYSNVKYVNKKNLRDNPHKIFVWNAPNSATLSKIEHVVIHVEINAPHTSSCVEIVLCGPSGVCSVLRSSSSDNSNDKNIDWSFMTVRHWGEPVVQPIDNGKWMLHIKDLCSRRKSVNVNTKKSIDGNNVKKIDKNERNVNIGELTLRSWGLKFYGQM